MITSWKWSHEDRYLGLVRTHPWRFAGQRSNQYVIGARVCFAKLPTLKQSKSIVYRSRCSKWRPNPINLNPCIIMFVHNFGILHINLDTNLLVLMHSRACNHYSPENVHNTGQWLIRFYLIWFIYIFLVHPPQRCSIVGFALHNLHVLIYIEYNTNANDVTVCEVLWTLVMKSMFYQ